MNIKDLCKPVASANRVKDSKVKDSFLEDKVVVTYKDPETGELREEGFAGANAATYYAVADFIANLKYGTYCVEEYRSDKITDSSAIEQFVGDILFKGKATCPVTKKKYSISGTTLSVDDKKYEIPKTVEAAAKRIKEIVQKEGKVKDDENQFSGPEDGFHEWVEKLGEIYGTVTFKDVVWGNLLLKLFVLSFQEKITK